MNLNYITKHYNWISTLNILHTFAYYVHFCARKLRRKMRENPWFNGSASFNDFELDIFQNKRIASFLNFYWIASYSMNS